MILGWGGVGLAYSSARLWPGSPVTIPETALDRLIPYNEAGIWLYLAAGLRVGFLGGHVARLNLPCSWLLKEPAL